jgi:prefoldin subunit 5
MVISLCLSLCHQKQRTMAFVKTFDWQTNRIDKAITSLSGCIEIIPSLDLKAQKAHIQFMKATLKHLNQHLDELDQMITKDHQ